MRSRVPEENFAIYTSVSAKQFRHRGERLQKVGFDYHRHGQLLRFSHLLE